MIISKEFRFEASHVLSRHRGKCARLHGHSWVLVVSVEGVVDPETGFVLDYHELKDVVEAKVISRVDHQHLGEDYVLMGCEETRQAAVFGEDFYPSSENLIVKFAEILEPEFATASYRLCELRLKETCTSEAIWRPIWSHPK